MSGGQSQISLGKTQEFPSFGVLTHFQVRGQFMNFWVGGYSKISKLPPITCKFQSLGQLGNFWVETDQDIPSQSVAQKILSRGVMQNFPSEEVTQKCSNQGVETLKIMSLGATVKFSSYAQTQKFPSYGGGGVTWRFLSDLKLWTSK